MSKFDYGRIHGNMTNELLFAIYEQNERIIGLLENLQPKKAETPFKEKKSVKKDKKSLTCPKCGKNESPRGGAFTNKAKLSAHMRACKGVV